MAHTGDTLRDRFVALQHRLLTPRLSLLACLLASLLTGCLDADIRRGDDALGQGRYREAIAFYELARERLPEETTPLTRLASAHRALAMSHLDADRCDEARRHFEEAEGLTHPVLPDREALYACVERIQAPPAQHLADLAALREAGDPRTSTVQAYVKYALELGRDAEAVDLRPELVKRRGLTPKLQQGLALAYIRLGRLTEALADLEVATQLDKQNTLLRMKYGEALEASGDLERAERLYRALATELPQNALVQMRLAELLEKKGDTAGAAAARAKARAIRGVKAPGQRRMRPLRPSRR